MASNLQALSLKWHTIQGKHCAGFTFSQGHSFTGTQSWARVATYTVFKITGFSLLYRMDVITWSHRRPQMTNSVSSPPAWFPRPHSSIPGPQSCREGVGQVCSCRPLVLSGLSGSSRPLLRLLPLHMLQLLPFACGRKVLIYWAHCSPCATATAKPGDTFKMGP